MAGDKGVETLHPQPQLKESGFPAPEPRSSRGFLKSVLERLRRKNPEGTESSEKGSSLKEKLAIRLESWRSKLEETDRRLKQSFQSQIDATKGPGPLNRLKIADIIFVRDLLTGPTYYGEILARVLRDRLQHDDSQSSSTTKNEA